MNDLIQQIRSADHDRFLAVQLAPAEKRPALYTLVALHIELARIAEIVSEPLIGHIRLAWWREALEEIEAGKPPRNHPLVQALAELHAAHPSLFARLYPMIEARGADLDTSLIAQEAAWLDYCDRTAGGLHMAMALVVDPTAAAEQADAIRTHAHAYAFVGLARAIPFQAAQGWLRFPHARLNEQGLTSLAPSATLPAFVKQVVADALAMLPATPIDRRLKPLRALAALTQLHAAQLQRAGCDPYQLRLSRLATTWCVLKANIMECSFF